MRFMNRTSDEDAERLLERRVPWGDGGSELGEVSIFLDAVRAEVPVPTSPAAEAALVPLLAEAARESEHGLATAPTRPLPAAAAARRGAWRPRVALAAKVAVAVALLPAAMAGLAFAGVTLPQPAREAMERIGLDLPNQSAVDEESTASGDEVDDEQGAATKQSRGDGESSTEHGGAESGGPARRSSRDDRGRGQNPSADGQPGRDSQGQGTPQLGEPAPITPPGQGGTPPGQGGPSPSQAPPQPQSEVGPPGGVPPGQAKQVE
jgi:hypothetical protein